MSASSNVSFNKKAVRELRDSTLQLELSLTGELLTADGAKKVLDLSRQNQTTLRAFISSLTVKGKVDDVPIDQLFATLNKKITAIMRSAESALEAFEAVKPAQPLAQPARVAPPSVRAPQAASLPSPAKGPSVALPVSPAFFKPISPPQASLLSGAANVSPPARPSVRRTDFVELTAQSSGPSVQVTSGTDFVGHTAQSSGPSIHYGQGSVLKRASAFKASASADPARPPVGSNVTPDLKELHDARMRRQREAQQVQVKPALPAASSTAPISLGTASVSALKGSLAALLGNQAPIGVKPSKPAVSAATQPQPEQPVFKHPTLERAAVGGRKKRALTTAKPKFKSGTDPESTPSVQTKPAAPSSVSSGPAIISAAPSDVSLGSQSMFSGLTVKGHLPQPAIQGAVPSLSLFGAPPQPGSIHGPSELPPKPPLVSAGVSSAAPAKPRFGGVSVFPRGPAVGLPKSALSSGPAAASGVSINYPEQEAMTHVVAKQGQYDVQNGKLACSAISARLLLSMYDRNGMPRESDVTEAVEEGAKVFVAALEARNAVMNQIKPDDPPAVALSEGEFLNFDQTFSPLFKREDPIFAKVTMPKVDKFGQLSILKEDEYFNMFSGLTALADSQPGRFVGGLLTFNGDRAIGETYTVGIKKLEDNKYQWFFGNSHGTDFGKAAVMCFSNVLEFRKHLAARLTGIGAQVSNQINVCINIMTK